MFRTSHVKPRERLALVTVALKVDVDHFKTNTSRHFGHKESKLSVSLDLNLEL